MNFLKKESVRYGLLLLVILLFFWGANGFFHFSTLSRSQDVSFNLVIETFIARAIDEGFFPHWIPSYYSGMPFFANPQNQLVRFFVPFYALTGNLIVAIKLELMMLSLLGGVGMYVLMLSLRVRPAYSVVSALVYLFNASTLVRFMGIGDEHMAVYVWLPWLWYCMRRGFLARGRDYVVWGVLSGVVLAIQFQTGYPGMFLFSGFFALLYFVFMVGFRISYWKRALLLGVVLSLVFLGLSAVKLLPVLEFREVSSVAAGRTLEDARGSSFDLWARGPFTPLVYLADKEGVRTGSFDQIAIGVPGLVLMLLGFMFVKKREVLFSVILLLVLFLVASGGFLFELLWKFFPGFDSQHHIGRILMLALLPVSVLAGFGMQYVFSAVKKHVRMQWYVADLALLLVLLLVLVSLGFFRVSQDYAPLYWHPDELVAENDLMQFFASDDNLFRIHDIADLQIGTTAVVWSTALDLELVHGAFNVWLPSYLAMYVWGALPHAPLKFLSMLNTKYVYSATPLNHSSLSLINTFDACSSCRHLYPNNSPDGPYLYLLTTALPRAYTVQDAVLVVGDGALDAMYQLMLHPSFDPATTALVISEGLNVLRYPFSAVIVSGNLDPVAFDRLTTYRERGGRVLPDVFGGEKSLSAEVVASLFSGFTSAFSEAEASRMSPNHLRVDADEGFLVLSEKFYLFEGWQREHALMQGNGVQSVLYLNEGASLDFSYSSIWFTVGAWISSLMLVVVVGFLFWRRKAIR